MPDHGYEPSASVRELSEGRLVVAFHGDDDRRRVFDVSRLPLPGWHRALAAAVAERTGPGGGLRTFSAASTGWAALGRLVRFLGSLPQPPVSPDQLRPGHLDAFRVHQAKTTPGTALRDLGEARMLFMLPALRETVSAEVLDHVQRRLPAAREAEPAVAGPHGESTPSRTGAKRCGRASTNKAS